MDLAFERAGIPSVLQCEINRDCLDVLARHWPNTPRETDVRTLTAPATADVVHFGSPCQDLSLAGKRRGFGGERSGLFAEAIRVIRDVRPEFALWENVAGALSSAHGADFATALDYLADCGAVDIAWRVLDAQWFGVAQRRRRVFVVADFRGQRAGEILFEREGGPRHPPPRRGTGKEVAGSLGGGAYGSGRRSEHDPNLVLAFKGGQGSAAGSLGVGENVAPTLGAAESGSNRTPVIASPDIAPTLTAGTAEGPSHGKANGQDRLVFAIMERGESDAPIAGDHHRQDLDNETYIPDVAYAVRARDGKGIGFVDGDATLVAQQWRVRRLTPLECERLQGMPDGWTRERADGRPLSDTPRYRMLGNSVAVPVVEWIARRMKAASE